MSKAKDDPIKWVVCGRAIGTATGWDQTDTFEIQLYNFVGGDGYRGPNSVDGTINIAFERGYIETFDENGAVIEQCDLITAISDCPQDHIV